MTLERNYANQINKIDNFAIDGLTGVFDSLGYKVAEIERHHHGWLRGFEVAGTPTATHKADRYGSGAGAFQIDAGNDTWGSWLQVLGSGDTPADVGMVCYDFNYLLITASERTSLYYIQIGFGETGAAALTAGTYSDKEYKATSVSGRPAPLDIMTRRVLAGVNCWIRCKCPGQNTATLDFVFSIHEYEG